MYENVYSVSPTLLLMFMFITKCKYPISAVGFNKGSLYVMLNVHTLTAIITGLTIKIVAVSACVTFNVTNHWSSINTISF